MNKLDGAPDYFWLEPLRQLLEETAIRHPTFMWWQNVIGGSQGQSLYHTQTFCEVESSFAPEWTLENLVTFGPNEVLRLWALKEIRDKYCDTGGGA